jgi:tetratricopeptide (TPR) repeat protein
MPTALSLLVVFIAPGPLQAGAAADPLGVFAQAVKLQQAGQIDQAIAEYQRFLALQPRNVEARSNLGAAFASQGRYPEAIEQYQLALAANESNATVRFNLAVAYYKTSDVQAAATELEKLVAAAPADKRAVVLLADCRLRLGENPKVIELLTPLEESDPNDLAVTYALGTALIRDDQVAKGQRLVDKILKRGDTPEAHLMVGTAHLMVRDFAAAREEFAKTVALNPKLPGAHAYYGRALMATGSPSEAAEQFRQELELNPNDFEANLFVGVLEKQDQKYEPALARFRKALTMRPRDLGVRYQIATVLLLLGNVTEAQQLLEGILKDAPQFLEAHVSLATAYYRLKRKEDGDRERALVRELNQQAQAKAPGARDDLGPAYRGEILPESPAPDPPAPPE